MAITKHGNGFRIDFRDQHGKRSRVIFPTRKDADIALSKIKVKVKSGEYVFPKDVPTFEAAGASWLAGKAKRRPRTLAKWRAHLARHLYPAIGHLRLDQITVERIERLRTELQQPTEPGIRPLGDGATKNIIATLGAVL